MGKYALCLGLPEDLGRDHYGKGSDQQAGSITCEFSL